MKKKSILLFASLFAIASCELDRFPLDTLSEKDLFSTESGLLAYSNSFYSTVFSGGADLYEDDADTYIRDADRTEYKNTTRITPASGGGWSFTSLRKYNTLLDNVARYCTDENLATKYSAIARFFRGYYYSTKVARFGDVPWIEHELGSDSPELYRARDSRDSVMKLVIKDLDYAAANMVASKSVYTVTKWTALAVKSRACLFEGTFRKYHDIPGWEFYLQECMKASKTLIDESGYDIYNNGDVNTTFRDLFTPMSSDGRTVAHYQGAPQACEVILARNYNSAYGQTHSANFDKLAAGKGRLSITRKYVASFLMKDGSRFTDKSGWQTMTFAQECEDRDPRLAQCMRTPGYTRIGESTKAPVSFAATVTGYCPTKYIVSTDYDDTGRNDNDLILFRLPEILLNWIEAKAELGETISDKDLDYSINRLRDRVGMPHMTTSVGEPDGFLLNTDWGGFNNSVLVNMADERLALILEIRRERAVELGQEGFRWDDIRRWGEGQVYTRRMYGMYFPGVGEYDIDGDGEKDVLLYKGGDTPTSTIPNLLDISSTWPLSADDGNSGMIEYRKGYPGRWDEDIDSLYPVPLQELELNPKLKQNYGWDDIKR